MKHIIALSLIATLAVACSDDSDDNGNSNSTTKSDMSVATGQDMGGGTTAQDMATKMDMVVVNPDMSTTMPDAAIQEDMSVAGEDMATEVDMATGTDMNTSGGDGQVVPTNAAAIFTYLQDKKYSTLAAEPAIHSATGNSPHGMVRTYVNDVLKASIEANNTSHPIGSAAIKELYNGNQELTGWAAEVKVTDTNNSGDDWYWYEVFSTTNGSNPFVDGTGVGTCTGCHSGGVDFVVSAGPFAK